MSLFSKHYSRGFTLTEMIVCIAIMGVVVTIIMFNQSKYTEGAALSQLADEMATTINEARVYGNGVKELSTGSGNFAASYGVMFQPNPTGYTPVYFTFSDLAPKNGSYDGPWACPTGGGLECLEAVLITRNNRISDVCGIRQNGTEMCNLGRVDITFTRPDSSAHFIYWNSGMNTFDPGNFVGAKVVLISPNGLTRSISIYSSGQVSVQ